MASSNNPVAMTSRALEEERWRLFELWDELPGIVYVRGPEYSIQFADRQFRERFGDPAAGTCYQVIHRRQTPCEPCSCDTVLVEKRTLHSEWVFADGTSYQLSHCPFVDMDGVRKVLHLGIDTTWRRQAEAELARANRELQALSRTEHRERVVAESLAEAALALNSSLDSAEVLDRILEQTQRVVPCAAASVMLVENDQARLVRQRGIESWSSPELERLEAGVPLESMPRLQAACRSRQPLLVEDTRIDPLDRLANGLEWVRSLVALPMIQGESVLGLITLLSDRAGFFARESVVQLGSFASHAALAIGNARLYQSMKDGREQLQSLSRRLVEIQENERRHVARELHDEAGQALTSLMLQLKLLQRDAENPARVQASTADLIAEVEAVMENLHRLAMDLRPASLDHLGLSAVLDQHCRTLKEQHQIQVAFQAVGLEGRIAPEVETALYRIVQEALNNVVRHARATRADVLLERRSDRIVVMVKDNGQGFDPEATVGSNHLGLVGIQERAMALGGSLTIESTPYGGTAVLVEVPSDHPNSDCG